MLFSMRIAQISDFHFTHLCLNPFRLTPKRLIGTINWLCSRKKIFSKDQVNELPELLASLHVDRILLGGDFTSTSLHEEYQMGADFAGQLPAPWIAIPGNHDHYTQIAWRKKHFYRTFENARKIDHRSSFFSLKEHGIEAHKLSDNWWLVALDTARATWTNSARGLFSEVLEERMAELLALLPIDAKILVLNHYPFFQNDIYRHNLARGEALEAVLRKDARIKAYLHGHTHRHILADLQASGLPVVLDSGCAADSHKGSWNLLTIDDEKMQVDVYKYESGWKVGRTEIIPWTR